MSAVIDIDLLKREVAERKVEQPDKWLLVAPDGKVSVAGAAPVVEWQASANGGEWRRIVPPRGKTIAGRVAYLRTFIRANGVPTYRIRALVVQG